MNNEPKIPYCSAELKKGYIPTRRDIGLVWYPEDVKCPLFVTEDIIRKKDGIQLNDPDLGFGDCKVTAYVCRSCRKGIFSYDG